MSISKKESANQFKVFISNERQKCNSCKNTLSCKSLILLKPNKKVICMKCAGLQHLVLLPSGNVAMTRRSKKHSRLKSIPVVMGWSRAKRRYERKGILLEKKAIRKAKKECRLDAGERKLRQLQRAIKAAEFEKKYIAEFALHIRKFFPFMPKDREFEIAKHACTKYSRRIGRSANAKEFDKRAVKLAVIAHIRHIETNYDEQLCDSVDRLDARKKIAKQVNEILQKWQKNNI